MLELVAQRDSQHNLDVAFHALYYDTKGNSTQCAKKLNLDAFN